MVLPIAQKENPKLFTVFTHVAREDSASNRFRELSILLHTASWATREIGTIRSRGQMSTLLFDIVERISIVRQSIY